MILRPAWPLCLLLIAAAEPDHGPRFGLSCAGAEIRREGQGEPLALSYAARLSIDLMTRRFCLDACTRDRSFPIVDPIGRPIRLIDSRIATQRRVMMFDPATMVLTDESHLTIASLPALERRITATCRIAPFREPAEVAE